MMIHIALTTGEPAGIGPEISVRAASQFLDQYDDVVIHLIGDKALLNSSNERLIIEHQALSKPVKAGELNVENAKYVISTLDHAIDGCIAGTYDAMVTAPVQKSIISESGVTFTGHTEYFAEKTGTQQVVMMLATRGLRVALVTTHLPLREIADAITVERVERVTRILHADLQQKFGIAQPRILVCGLNPHAGEGGHLGHEEIDIIEPTLERLRQEGMDLRGPLPADTLFTPKYLEHCDAVLAMYHDQGLPVLKYKGFGAAVNVTLGLPIIRTSVDHGTALDLAGSGKIDTGSLHVALETAYQMAETRI